MNTTIICSMAFALSILIIYLVYSAKKKAVYKANRINVVLGNSGLDAKIKEVEKKFQEKDREQTFLQKLENKLSSNHSEVTLPMYFVILVASIAIWFIVGYVVLGNAVMAIPVSFVGITLPKQIVESRAIKNKAKFNERLVRALRQLASSLRTGMSVQQALEEICSNDMIDPKIRGEFAHVLEDMQTSMHTGDAFMKMYGRTGSSEIQDLAVAIKTQQEFGGKQSELVEIIISNITAKAVTESEIRALMSEAESTIRVFDIAPYVMVVGLFIISPHFFDPLMESMGMRILTMALLILMFVGGFVLRKTIRNLMKG